MYKKTISGLSIIAAAFGLAAFSAPASAACNTDTQNDWECLEVGGTDLTSQTTLQGPYTFAGPAQLSHWFTGTLNCTLTAAGKVDVDTANDQTKIQVSSLTSSGGGSCGSVTFGGLPVNATVPDADDVYTADTGSTTDTTDDSLVIYYNGTSVCNDTVVLTFGNDVNHTDKDQPSYFDFNDSLSGWAGSCSVDGTLTTSGYTDVNAW